MKPADGGSEPIEPTVRAILDDVVIQEGGVAFIDNYASWVIALRKLPLKESSRIFVQLAVVARQFYDAGCAPVALSLAALARIGLTRLTRQDVQSARP